MPDRPQAQILTRVKHSSDAFKTPTDPAAADLNTLQNQLNTYLAMEAGVRVSLYQRIHSAFRN
jgi:hypothetical protein